MRSHLWLLAPALLLAGPSFAQTAPPLPEGTMLSITAEGHTARVPDVATIHAGV